MTTTIPAAEQATPPAGLPALITHYIDGRRVPSAGGETFEVLAPTMRQDPDGLFGEEQKLEIRCPRCGARYIVTREALETFVAQNK